MEGEIVNRVAQSGLITIDLEEFIPAGQRVDLDLKAILWQEMALREKDLRDFIKTHDWAQYDGQHVAVHCSADAIVPNWAYMLLTTALTPHASSVFYGTLEAMETDLVRQAIAAIDENEYTDQRLLIKGCSNTAINPSAYVDIVKKLQPKARSLMFGEACSNVPIYKKPKQK